MGLMWIVSVIEMMLRMVIVNPSSIMSTLHKSKFFKKFFLGDRTWFL